MFYRVNEELPDDTGMIMRAPQKQESFVNSIPLDRVGENDNKPLMSSFDGSSVDEQITQFKDLKVLINFTIYRSST